jgi:hypothetical protein
MFGAFPLRVRGTTYGPVDPAAAYEEVIARAGATAGRVRDLSVDELRVRLQRLDAEVWNASVGPPVSVGFRRQGAHGSLLLYPTNGAFALPLLQKQLPALAFARDGDALITVQGDGTFATKAFLEQVLVGTGATIEEYRR